MCRDRAVPIRAAGNPAIGSTEPAAAAVKEIPAPRSPSFQESPQPSPMPLSADGTAGPGGLVEFPCSQFSCFGGRSPYGAPEWRFWLLRRRRRPFEVVAKDEFVAHKYERLPGFAAEGVYDGFHTGVSSGHPSILDPLRP